MTEKTDVTVKISPITSEQDAVVCHIIRTVGAEFGAVGEGFGPGDAEVQAMSRHYSEAGGSQYLVASVNGVVAGGCGIAPFSEDGRVCELRKLFLLPEYRGSGLGKALTLQCLAFARTQGYRECYLDTLSGMTSAIRLYESLGFRRLKQPPQETIHNGCDVWMLLDLT